MIWFWEKLKDSRINSATGLLLAIMVAGGSGFIFLYDRHSEIQKVAVNVQFVVDTSIYMALPFDEYTRWDAVKLAIGPHMDGMATSDNLSLRHFGGECGGDNTEVIVPFAQRNRKMVAEALDSLQLYGRATLLSGIVEATGDFNNPERFGGVVKQIIVITSGADACYEDYIERIRKRLETTNVVASYTFIGMNPDFEEQVSLIKLAEATNGNAVFVDSLEELVLALDGRLEEKQPSTPEADNTPIAQPIDTEKVVPKPQKRTKPSPRLGSSSSASASSILSNIGSLTHEHSKRQTKKFADVLNKRQSWFDDVCPPKYNKVLLPGQLPTNTNPECLAYFQGLIGGLMISNEGLLCIQLDQLDSSIIMGSFVSEFLSALRAQKKLVPSRKKSVIEIGSCDSHYFSGKAYIGSQNTKPFLMDAGYKYCRLFSSDESSLLPSVRIKHNKVVSTCAEFLAGFVHSLEEWQQRDIILYMNECETTTNKISYLYNRAKFSPALFIQYFNGKNKKLVSNILECEI